MCASQTTDRKKPVAKQIVATKTKDKRGLLERLEERHLLKIYNAFQDAERCQLDKTDLAKLLYKVARIDLEDDFELLFYRINIKKDGYVTWDEFISHLILEYQDKEILVEFSSLEMPISRPYRLLRSNHRPPVSRITFFPTLAKDGSYDFSDGNYVTCSKDGIINYWTLDFTLDRTVQSTCPLLKVQPTWVLDMVCMPDVSVVCTSSTERDLRFYDTSARKFELRIMMSSLEDAVICMHYEFNNDPTDDSKLILGDKRGNVKIMLWDPAERGPFKSKPGTPLLHVRWEKVIKGLVPGFRVLEFRGIHLDWVRQVSYYKSLHGVLSCTMCPKTSLILKDLSGKIFYTYKVPLGVCCFDVCERAHTIATGGPDCNVRVWNSFVPSKQTSIFRGHHTSITAVVLQDNAKFLYSMSKDKCIKVWDTVNSTLLQTYTALPSELGEYTDLTILYNYTNCELIIGCVMICILKLNPKYSSEHTDGSTHKLGVSCILYNTLFKVVITTGLDSYIIVWDPWTGRRMCVVRNAHTRELHGETLPIEITAATFDPGNQVLLTGASDGSLKTWNFNTGTCLRNMSIESGCEVTSVVWIKGRILAIGWNRHVTEFEDSGGAAGPGGAFSKPWDTRHTEDVLCATARIPQTLATSTYNGELVLWKLETGQPYKIYNVAHPTGRIKIDYKIDRGDRRKSQAQQPQPAPTQTGSPSQPTSPTPRGGTIGKRKLSNVAAAKALPTKTEPLSGGLTSSPQARSRRISFVRMPEMCVPLRGLAVHCMLFLNTRPMEPKIATLLIAVENGTVQVWSHHPSGGFIMSFQGIHKAGDYVISMATDIENQYLFTGTTAGYIKTWLMVNFYSHEQKYICMPKLRLTFPFLLKDFIECRAKRVVRGQALPMLLNSYKAHMMPISGLTFIDEVQILLSSSADSSARMWSLGGRYMQTIGTFKPWNPIQQNQHIDENFPFSLPTDLKRLCSFTTLKVFNGGKIEKRITKRQELKNAEKNKKQVDVTKGTVYGKRIMGPILGNYFSLPPRNPEKHDFTLDTSFSYIPVYQHLIMPPASEVDRPCTPDFIEELQMRERSRALTSRVSKTSIKSNASHKAK